jgi:hypothetical protein
MKPFEQRDWNYYFEKGDKVKLCDDWPSERAGELFRERYKNAVGKTGVIIDVYSDLHAFCCGKIYRVSVDFDGEIVEGMAQIFIKVDEL